MTAHPPGKKAKPAARTLKPRPSAVPAAQILTQWLITTSSMIGAHRLHLMTERNGARAVVMDDLRALARTHYVTREAISRRIAQLGAPKAAAILRDHLPTTKSARSGDLGEILATEIAEQTLGYRIPVRRLRWKDGRNMALRGDDIVGIRHDRRGRLSFLKGESKSRVALSGDAVRDAARALGRDRGRPGRHAVLYVADRLRDAGDDALATELEEAVLASFARTRVEQFLFVLTGSDPDRLLTRHLTRRGTRLRRRHAVGLRVCDHGDFIRSLFAGF